MPDESSKPAEAKPAAKPAEAAKPAAKPAEAKPAAKPVEAKPEKVMEEAEIPTPPPAPAPAPTPASDISDSVNELNRVQAELDELKGKLQHNVLSLEISGNEVTFRNLDGDQVEHFSDAGLALAYAANLTSTKGTLFIVANASA